MAKVVLRLTWAVLAVKLMVSPGKVEVVWSVYWFKTAFRIGPESLEISFPTCFFSQPPAVYMFMHEVQLTVVIFHWRLVKFVWGVGPVNDEGSIFG